MNEKTYPGLDEDLKLGMTSMAKIILDARVFGLIPDDETCKGWTVGGILALYDKTTRAWEPFGSLPSRLPEDLARRHRQIFDAAIKTAKENGWDPERELE